MDAIKKFHSNWSDAIYTDLQRCLRAFVAGNAIVEIINKKPRTFKLINDGKNVLRISGLLSVLNIQTRYNVPISIWIQHQYPVTPPTISIACDLISPNNSIILIKSHPHVDENGMIYLPYLSTWNPQISTILDIMAHMVKIFEGNLPIRSIPVCPSPIPPPPPSVAEESDKDRLIKNAIASIATEIQQTLWNNTITNEDERSLDWIDKFATKIPVITEMKDEDPLNYRLAKAVALGLAIETHLSKLQEFFMMNPIGSSSLEKHITDVRSLGRRLFYAYNFTKERK